MPAYVIGETNVTDHEQYERYRDAAPASARKLREGAAKLHMVAVDGVSM